MTAIVFPGQGSQITGMGKDFYDSFQEVKDTFGDDAFEDDIFEE